MTSNLVHFGRPGAPSEYIKIAERNVNDRSDLDVFLRELEYLKAFDHPNIVKFHEVYQDETKYYLVMEYLYIDHVVLLVHGHN